jgi:hypothetical protein
MQKKSGSAAKKKQTQSAPEWLLDTLRVYAGPNNPKAKQRWASNLLRELGHETADGTNLELPEAPRLDHAS